jgi:hypothetical protein
LCMLLINLWRSNVLSKKWIKMSFITVFSTYRCCFSSVKLFVHGHTYVLLQVNTKNLQFGIIISVPIRLDYRN